MKLMFYINTIHHGGAERVMSELAAALANKGNQCVLVTSFPDPIWEYPLDPSVKRINLEREEIKDGFVKKNIRRTRLLRTACKKEKPDVLISFMPQPILRALAATIGLKVKNVISIRNDPALYWNSGIFKVLAKMLLPRVDMAVFQTEDARNYYRGHKIIENSKIILNPVDDKFFEVKNDLTSRRIVSCGRLDKQKNYSLLIKAFAKLQPENAEWTLHIYGVGELRSELQREIYDLHMEAFITLEGASDNIPEVLSNTGIFVLSSNYEGLPNALMEALAAGVPCISTDCPCGGPKTLISDGINGLLVRTDDFQDMTRCLNQLMNSQSLRNRIATNAKIAAEKYRKSQIVEQWLTMLSDLGSINA